MTLGTQQMVCKNNNAKKKNKKTILQSSSAWEYWEGEVGDRQTGFEDKRWLILSRIGEN